MNKRQIITCCFTGHRPQNLSFKFDETHPDCMRIKNTLTKCIRRLITEHDVTHFISGMAIGVDMWAAEAILALKKEFPSITLESAIPCETQAIKWNTKDRERYYRILSKCDKETMVHRHYTTTCMHKRNEYMIDQSSFVIAVWNGVPGGTGNTIRYALSKGKFIICIDPTTGKLKSYTFRYEPV